MSYSTRESLGWLTCIFILVLLIGFLGSAGIIDGGGRQANEHAGAVPESAVRIKDDTYLVQGVASFDRICGDGVSSSNAIPSERAWLKTRGEPILLRCHKDQFWNQHGPRSIDYSDAMAKVGSSPIAWGVIGGLFLLCFTYPILKGTSEIRASRKQIKAQKRQQKVDSETKRRELAKAYADGAIDDVEFEKGLDRAYKL